ncbi:MAG: hypothetical protein PVF05_09070 [Gemmatimonadales bacterium]|jgi:uncharacterized ion transporter superfamily protein YfcC
MSALSRLRLPHPFLLLLGGVAVAAVLTWALPAGQFDRAVNPDTGASVVVAGTYHSVEAAPVGPFQALMAVPQGFIDGADIIVLVLFVGSAFVLLDQTGALARLVGVLVDRVRHPSVVIALVCLLFAILGAAENTYEEIIALVPVLLLLSRRVGFGAVTALAMSVGAATVGAAFGPTNPFATAIALRYAELPPQTTLGLRVGILVAAVAVWTWWTISQAKNDDVVPVVDEVDHDPATGRDVLMLVVALVPFAIYVYGILKLDWGFNELSALFIFAGYTIGLLAGYGLGGTTERLLKGMEALLAAALVIGVARSISVVLTQGNVIDTIVYGLSAPLARIPSLVAAGLMVPIHALLHVPVPSNSGQAVLTMPIFAPTADLLGIPRNVAVLAYQTGGVMMDVVTPTNGALLAMLLAARVPFARWLKFAIPGMLLVMAVGLVGMALAM